MKSIISVLTDSPFYFTMSLRDRHELVKRLASKQPGQEEKLDLSHYELKVSQYLNIDEIDLPKQLYRYSPFDQKAID